MYGGGCGQFVVVLLNLFSSNDISLYFVSGFWFEGVVIEVNKYNKVVVVGDVLEKDGLQYVVLLVLSDIDQFVVYYYFCFNEIVDGIVYDWLFEVGSVFLVLDMLFIILLQLLDVVKYGVIYVGVQKNIGLSGLLVVIVREDFVGNVCKEIFLIFDYVLVVKFDFMYNMLLIFLWYLVGFVFEWFKDMGGVDVMVKCNLEKVVFLYFVIDSFDFYLSKVYFDNCLKMNVLFYLVDFVFDSLFLE